MKKRGFLVFVILAALMSTGLYFVQGAKSDDIHREELVIVRKDGTEHTFKVEIAANPVDRKIGLMYRTSMEPDHGMLFQMETTTVTRFWMKNTLIPLDMLFIAPDGIIKTVHANAVPKSLDPVSSQVPVNAVLELNGGRAAALSIVPGDKVVHSFFNTSK